MSSPRIIATRRQKVLMCHICSTCHCPVISVVQIDAESQKSYSMSRQKAEQIASETAENAIEHEIERIESCKTNKTILTSTEFKKSMISPGYFCTSSISGFNWPCPICNTTEPWQTLNSSNKIENLCPENFPIVFTKIEDANTWAYDYVFKTINYIHEKHKDNALVKQATIATLKEQREIDKLEETLNSIPELQEKQLLKDHLKECQTRKSQLGILDLKRQKETKTQIKANELKLSDISQIIFEKTNPLVLHINKLKASQRYWQAVAFDCVDEVAMKDTYNSVSYYYIPNEIPANILHSTLTSQQDDNQSEAVHEHTMDSKKMQSNNDVKFCRKCGFKLLSGSIFCSKCGTKVG